MGPQSHTSQRVQDQDSGHRCASAAQAEKAKKKDKSTLRCLVLVVPEGQAQSTSTLYRTPAASISSFGTLRTGYYIQHRRHWTVDQALGEVTKKCFRCRGRCPCMGDQPYPGLVRPLRSRRHAPEL